jgi:hypothetical protein
MLLKFGVLLTTYLHISSVGSSCQSSVSQSEKKSEESYKEVGIFNDQDQGQRAKYTKQQHTQQQNHEFSTSRHFKPTLSKLNVY